MAGAAVDEDPDDPFGSGREMRLPWGEGIRRQKTFILEEGGESEKAGPASGAVEQGPAGKHGGCHGRWRNSLLARRAWQKSVRASLAASGWT
jgi:hypothetical protein